MAIFTWNAIFLGNAPDMDPDDADFTAENAASLLGSYGSTSDPLKNNVVEVRADDADDDSTINYDDPSETLEIDGVSNTLDSAAVYTATITYMDGTTANISAVIMQTSNGDLYLAPELSNNADLAAMEAGPIRSISLDSVSVNTTSFGANRQQTEFVCFVNGTLIETPTGPRAIEDLRCDDLVMTCDGGAMPIRWTGCSTVSICRQIADPRARPVRLAPGALGHGLPHRTLLLSRQHRVLLVSPVAERMFAERQVLIAAKRLIGMPGITLDHPRRRRAYHHIALDRHALVRAEGTWSETFWPGIEAMRRIGTENPVPPCVTPVRTLVEGPRAGRFVARLRGRVARTGATPCEGMPIPVAMPPSPGAPHSATRDISPVSSPG